MQDWAPESPLVFMHRDFHPAICCGTGEDLAGIVDWAVARLGPPGADLAHTRRTLALVDGRRPRRLPRRLPCSCPLLRTPPLVGCRRALYLGGRFLGHLGVQRLRRQPARGSPPRKGRCLRSLPVALTDTYYAKCGEGPRRRSPLWCSRDAAGCVAKRICTIRQTELWSEGMDVLMAEGSDIAELAGCLAASYRDNPLFGWMFADALNHVLLCEIFTGLVEAGLPDHCVYKTRGGGGAAIWSPPRHYERAPSSSTDSAQGFETAHGRRSAALAVLKSQRPARPHLPSRRRSAPD